jgi:mRNA-degrading endonuclease YafQ of YafQ-DinJ toxin-antitoxin module
MKIVQSHSFAKAVKKLHTNQKQALDAAIETLRLSPTLGDMKVGDLAGLRVYKFRMVGQLTLLAYTWEDDILTLTLFDLGSHENLYRDMKR